MSALCLDTWTPRKSFLHVPEDPSHLKRVCMRSPSRLLQVSLGTVRVKGLGGLSQPLTVTRGAQYAYTCT